MSLCHQLFNGRMGVTSASAAYPYKLCTLPAALIRPISLQNDGAGTFSPSGEPQSAVAICAASDVRLGLALFGQIGPISIPA